MEAKGKHVKNSFTLLWSWSNRNKFSVLITPENRLSPKLIVKRICVCVCQCVRWPIFTRAAQPTVQCTLFTDCVVYGTKFVFLRFKP